MNRQQIITELKTYFKITELVCPHTYSAWGDNSWNFLDTNYLHTLLVLRRDIFKLPMVCNTKTQTQRGTRCNLCQLVKDKTSRNEVYLTQHLFGKGGDFNIAGNVLTAENMRTLIKTHQSLLPVPIRIERHVSWLHFDVMNYTASKIYEF